mgnify:CR=1 FL=1
MSSSVCSMRVLLHSRMAVELSSLATAAVDDGLAWPLFSEGDVATTFLLLHFSRLLLAGC